MHIDQPYHEGERLVQERLNEEAEAQRNGRAISNSIVHGAFRFIENQPLAVIGSVSDGGKAHASLVFGEPGFAQVIDDRALELHLERTIVHEDDPCLQNLERDPRAGLLFIEPATRRRLRVNGRVQRDGNRLRIDVDEAYPNCPKYIRRRHLATRIGEASVNETRTAHGTTLGADEAALILGSDTFFVASSNPKGGVDVSHRGGEPGFTELVDERTLRIPDYPGNRMYNTLGNFAIHPEAGATFLDFESGRVLMLGGKAEIVWSVDGRETETMGTNRYWTLTIDEWRSFELPVRLEWESLEPES